MAGAVITIKAKTPKGPGGLTKKTIGMRAALVQQMRQLVADAHREVAAYPAPNSDYRRTGTYGKRWSTTVEVFPSSIVGRVGSNLSYAVYVGGPKSGGKGNQQTAVMASKGWVSVTDALDHAWKKNLRGFSKILLQGSKLGTP